MEHLTEILMKLISSEVLGKELDLSNEKLFDGKTLVDLLVLSKKHNVANIVASALLNNGYLENCPQKGQYMNEIYKAVFVQEKLGEAYREVTSVLEENKIAYIPLKGAVVRDFYPQPWMRTSCDADILVEEKNLKKALAAVESTDGYTRKVESEHDIQLKNSDGAVVELHFKLLGNKSSPLHTKILSTVWKTAEPSESSEFRYNLSDEFFYYYHILHMAKHFRLGGCGVRPFLDLAVIEKNFDIDSAKVRTLLEKGRLSEFEKNVRKLSRVWFGGEEHDEITLQMQKFILEGGTFGSAKTRAASVRQRSGGKVRYFFSRIFVPYRYLVRDYPVLRKHPVLTPFYAVRRWFSLAFGKKKDFRISYTETLNDAENYSYDSELFKKIGLK